MTCSPQTYRIRIGIYNIVKIDYRKNCVKLTNYSKKTLPRNRLCVSLILTTYCIVALSIPNLLKPQINPELIMQIKPSSSTLPYQLTQPLGITIMSRQSLDPGETKYTCGLNISHGWDPGGYTQTTVAFPWVDNEKQNKLAHITNGNRGQRGRGIKFIYWNKGPSILANKQQDLETILSTHKPHILGLGEANFRQDHNLEDVQLREYTLHLDSCVDNPDLGLARVAVYTHTSLRVKRRSDLEDSEVAAVWLECGLPGQQNILVCMGYRQWRLPRQQDSTSASIGEQLARWLVFLEMWEKALSENKEVVVALDANLDFLTWRQEDLPHHHSSVKLKALTDALFEKILPLGVTQLVKDATRFHNPNYVYRNVRPQTDKVYKIFQKF